MSTLHSSHDAHSTSLNGRTFTGVTNSADGDVGQATVFTYQQEGYDVWAHYSGGAVKRGYLVGTRTGSTLSFRYSHLGIDGQTSGGVCTSTIESLSDGRIRLHETWQWESRPGSGTSIVEEVPPAAAMHDPNTGSDDQ